jgi:hypothetical protein
MCVVCMIDALQSRLLVAIGIDKADMLEPCIVLCCRVGPLSGEDIHCGALTNLFAP